MQTTAPTLAELGFRIDPSTGRFWHWLGTPGIEFINGKWVPCDMLSSGEVQHPGQGYDSPDEAAKESLEFFK